MRIAIVGPAHPYKGGITMHTTLLAHHLTAAGHDVSLISWRSQYPFFYPGKQFVPEDQPELPVHAGATRVLSWKNPAGWTRWGRRLRGYDRLIFIWWVPTIQGPVYLSMLQAMGRKRPPVTLVCHNVLPHEPKPGDRQLAKALLRRCDQVITHTAVQAALAAQLTTKAITTVKLPLTMPRLEAKPVKKSAVTRQLVFFGFIRPYKGVDILLQAVAKVPDVSLIIAGEFWDDREDYDKLISQLKLKDRVTVIDGYVPADELGKLIQAADAVVLPYREGTASWNVSLAHAYGTPVIASTAGSLGAQVADEVDGLLCDPGDVASLARAINHFYEPGIAARLQAGVPTLSTEKDWQAYVQAIIGD